MESKTYKVGIFDENPYIKCLDCNMISYNEYDIKHLYCGSCHEFHDFKMMKNKLGLPYIDETFQEYSKRRHPLFYAWHRTEPYVVGVGVLCYFAGLFLDIVFPHAWWTVFLSLFRGYAVGAGFAAYYIRRREQQEKETAEKWQREHKI